MEQLKTHIALRQSEFMNHEFFQILKEKSNSIEDVMGFAPYIAFWVMTFQDILRLNETQVTDPFLRKVARHHRLEDKDHDRWFIEDLHKLNLDIPLTFLFDKKFTSTRDGTFAIVAEVYKVTNDYLRIALLLTLESTGHIFFNAVADQLNRTIDGNSLLYFSKFHLDVEKAHEMFEQEMERTLFQHVLPAEAVRDGIVLINRIYDAFYQIFDGLVPYTKQSMTFTNPVLLTKHNKMSVVGVEHDTRKS